MQCTLYALFFLPFFRPTPLAHFIFILVMSHVIFRLALCRLWIHAFAAEARVARSARALKVGTLRPAIVLYDEPHPLGDDIGTIQTGDLAKRPDLLIVMGTSLKVHGLKKLVKEFARTVHAGAPSLPAAAAAGTGPAASSSKSTSTPRMSHKVIYVNKTAPGSEWNGIIDYHVEGTTDEWVERVVEQWRRDRPEDWEVQTTLDGPAASGVVVGEEGQKFKVTKGKTKGKSAFAFYRVSHLAFF